MANGLSRVTVVSPDRRMDVTLPGSVPIGELLPQLLQLCTDHADRTRAVAWTLRPVGGNGLRWASTLESARVRDGAILELSPRSVPASSVVEDLRDAIEDAGAAAMRIWSRRDTVTAAALTLAAVAALVLGLPHTWTAGGVGLAVAATIASAAIWGSNSLQRKGFWFAAHAFFVVGLAWTGAGVMIAATAATTLPAASRTGLAGATVACAAIGITCAIPRFAIWSASAMVAFGAGIGWAAIDLAGWPAQDAVAAGTVIGVLMLGVLPRACLGAGGLAGLDYVVRTRGCVERATVTRAFERSRALLGGALFSTAALTAVGSVYLGSEGSQMQLAQSITVAVSLMLRARAFTQVPHVMTLVLAGVGALLVLLISGLVEPAPDVITIVGLGMVVTVAAILAQSSLAPANDVAAARARRLLDMAESVAVAALVPMLASNLGVLDWVLRMVN